MSDSRVKLTNLQVLYICALESSFKFEALNMGFVCPVGLGMPLCIVDPKARTMYIL